jgi:phosphoribosylamine--glycine ligase
MKLFIVDPAGLGLDIATLALSQGHEVRHFISDTPPTKWIGHGVVTRARSLEGITNWPDVVLLTDNARYMASLDACRKESKAVWIGPTKEQSEWETDRKLGQDLLDKYGIPVAPYQIFSSFDAAIAYIKKKDDRLVCKPFGGAVDKALTYVSKGPEDMIFMLERWKKLGKMGGTFILQDFIDGVEFGVEGWFNGEEWAEGWHENFEFKKLLNDNLGPNTGEMGTVQRVVKESVIADKLLKPLTAHLKASHYVGFFDINCIVDKKGRPWPLEITARPGWPTFNLQLSLNKGDFVENLYRERAPRFTLNRTCTGVVIACPPFPYAHVVQKEVNGIPVWGFEDENLHHHPCEMMKDKEGQWVTAGCYICTVTGHGETVSESARAAYQNVKKLQLPNSPMYRTDIGKKLEKELPLLHKHNLAKQIRY